MCRGANGVSWRALLSVYSLSLSLSEFSKIAFATGAGFLIMGFIGFFVKLMYVPFFLLEHFSRAEIHGNPC
jgi:hypothetical protein